MRLRLEPGAPCESRVHRGSAAARPRRRTGAAHAGVLLLAELREAAAILPLRREVLSAGSFLCPRPRAVLARRVVFLIILRPDAAPIPIELDQRFFPAARNAIRLNMQYRYAAHRSLQ